MLSKLFTSLVLATSVCDARTLDDSVMLVGGVKSLDMRLLVKRADAPVVSVNTTVAKAAIGGAQGNAAAGVANVEQKNLHKDSLGRPLIRGGLLAGGIGGTHSSFATVDDTEFD